jgi:YD repeat-containing protein
MGTIPQYYFSTIRSVGYIPPNETAPQVCSHTYYTLTSNTTRQQETTQGNHVGYSQVTELFGENGENGKIIHYYYIHSDLGGDYFPFPPKTSNEWKRGMEMATKTYDRNGHLRKEEDNLYHLSDENSVAFHTINAIKIGWHNFITGPHYIYTDWINEFAFAPYQIYCGWKYKYKKLIIDYDTLGQNPVYDSTDFFYEHPDRYLEVTKTSHINSDGTEKITRYKYPNDYQGTSSENYAYAISMMRDSLHIVNSVIEYLESLRKTSDTSELITGGNIYLYKRFSPTNILCIHPYKSIGLETTTPIALSSFTKSEINGNGNFIFDSHFLTNKITYDTFDRFGNILNYHQTDNIPIALNWGYNNTLLITKVVNASYDPTNTYSNSPALITRFEYHPLIGVTRIIDPNGHSTKYEYDALGRLKAIRNDDNDILQKTDYHYKNN